MKRYGKYGRKVSWIVKRFGKYGRKVSWKIRLGKYRKKLWNDRENMEENSEMIWKIWNKVSWIVEIFGKYRAAAAAVGLKFHTKHVTNKNKTKHIMKISHINVNIYDKTATSQQNSD